ncbi:MAG: hypothetical protein QME66_06720 [Candidatus Eisenbacteria bacterium]|nr:hypothetical protein [Candidatus Eisenbacteria bacterium]
MQNPKRSTRTKTGGTRRAAVPCPKPRGKKKETAKYMGLCMNCEERETCTFLKTHGGVWHCEEYK